MSERRQLQTFTVLDLDRTILKSTTFFEKYVMPAIAAYYADLTDASVISAIMAVITRREQQQRGQAFDFIAVFNEIASEKNIPMLDSASLAEQLLKANVHEDGLFVEDIIADGGIELLQALDAEPRSAWGFYTTGGQQTQSLKLYVMRRLLEEHYVKPPLHWQIISSEHKADTIAREWHDEETGQFTIPEQLAGELTRAEQIRVIDDKSVNTHVSAYNTASAGIKTFLVQRAESADTTGVSLTTVAQHIRQSY